MAVNDSRIDAITMMRSWGDGVPLIDFLKSSDRVKSIFHIMGYWSYLVKTQFEDKLQLEEWLAKVKSCPVSDTAHIPAITIIETLKIIDEYKQGEPLTLEMYRTTDCKHHAFMRVDYLGNDQVFVESYHEHPAVNTIFHVQGEPSFIMEILTDNVDTIRKIIGTIKQHKTVTRVITQEVISVIKYI
jgi:hypothetical protein